MDYSFQCVIASRGYHVYKETSWSDATIGEDVKVELETNKRSIETDPYSCAIKAKHKYFIGWKTVGHIPREISRYVYFFIKEEGGKVIGTLKSLAYKPSPIPSGGLEVPLTLTFLCPKKVILDEMEEFVENFYSFTYTGIVAGEDEDTDDENVHFEVVSLEPECPQESIANKDEQSDNEQETSEDEAEEKIKFNENMELDVVKE